jgi:sulfite exporter TauE/SafE
MVEGLLLGLASGGTCLAFCAPVLLPLMLGAGQPVRANGFLLAEFLLGRLGGYLLFGMLAWWTGQRILDAPDLRAALFGSAYVVLAALLLAFGLAKPPAACLWGPAAVRKWRARCPSLLPLGLGFFTGLNLCPPFLLALAGAAYAGGLGASLLFFGAFFLGTSVYLIPLPFLGIFHRHAAVAWIGKTAAVLMAVYYLFSGILALIGGLAS